MSNVRITNQSGLNGGTVVGPGQTATGVFEGVQVVQDANFTAITSNLVNDTANLVGPTFNAGITIFGRVTEVTVGTGVVIAYNSSA